MSLHSFLKTSCSHYFWAPYYFWKPFTKSGCSGRSRIYQRRPRGANCKSGCVNLLLWPIFPKNSMKMKMKKLHWGGGASLATPFGSVNGLCNVNAWVQEIVDSSSRGCEFQSNWEFSFFEFFLCLLKLTKFLRHNRNS